MKCCKNCKRLLRDLEESLIKLDKAIDEEVLSESEQHLIVRLTKRVEEIFEKYEI
jgi:hypothetical protein